MGLLTADQINAIDAGAPFGHKFRISRPPLLSEVTIHDDTSTSSAYMRVVDPGRRDVSAYNVSMKTPGKLGKSEYVISVRNGDTWFSPYRAGNVWYYDGIQYHPRQCKLYHQVYLMVGGSWDAVLPLYFTGYITDVTYDVVNNTAEITSEGVGARELEREWTADDGHHASFYSYTASW